MVNNVIWSYFWIVFFITVIVLIFTLFFDKLAELIIYSFFVGQGEFSGLVRLRWVVLKFYLFCLLILLFSLYYHVGVVSFLSGMIVLRVDLFNLMLAGGMLLIMFFICLICFIADLLITRDECCLLVLLSFAGSFLFLMDHFVMILLAVELCTMILYSFASLHSRNRSDASLKYSLFSVISTTIFLFGILLIYYCVGTFNLGDIEIICRYLSMCDDKWTKLIFNLGSGFLIFSFLIKIGSAPFHYWAMDVYIRSSNLSFILFMGFTKIFLLGIFLKLFSKVLVINDYNLACIFICGIVNLIMGLSGSVYHENIKAFLSYSGLVPLGFFFMTFSNKFIISNIAAYLYIFGYSFLILVFITSLLSTATSFAKSQILAQDLSSLANLYQRSKFLMMCFMFCLVSLAGMPPFMGFVFKLNLLTSAFFYNRGLIFMFLMLGGVISCFYYLRILFLILSSTLSKLNRQKTTLYNFGDFLPKFVILSAFFFLINLFSLGILDICAKLILLVSFSV